MTGEAGASDEPDTPAIEYQGYRIRPTPYRTERHDRTAGIIELGIEASQAMVGRYMPWRPKVPSPTWRSFLHNHSLNSLADDEDNRAHLTPVPIRSISKFKRRRQTTVT